MGHPIIRIASLSFAAAALVLFWGGPIAQARTVLLARESTISATGTADSGDFNLHDGSQDCSGFADLVDTVDAGVDGPRISANQHSSPSVSPDAGFTGA